MIESDGTLFTNEEWMTMQAAVMRTFDFVAAKIDDDYSQAALTELRRLFYEKAWDHVRPLELDLIRSIRTSLDAVLNRMLAWNPSLWDTISAAKTIVTNKCGDGAAWTFMQFIVEFSSLVACAPNSTGRVTEEQLDRLGILISLSFVQEEWKMLQCVVMETVMLTSCADTENIKHMMSLAAKSGDWDKMGTYDELLQRFSMRSLCPDLIAIWKTVQASPNKFEEKIIAVESMLSRRLGAVTAQRFMEFLAGVGHRLAPPEAPARSRLASALLTQHSFARDDWFALLFAYLRILTDMASGDELSQNRVLEFVQHAVERTYDDPLHEAVVLIASINAEAFLKYVYSDVRSIDDVVGAAALALTRRCGENVAERFATFLCSMGEAMRTESIVHETSKASRHCA